MTTIIMTGPGMTEEIHNFLGGILDSYFGHKQQFKVKRLNDEFVSSNLQLFPYKILTDGLE